MPRDRTPDPTPQLDALRGDITQIKTVLREHEARIQSLELTLKRKQDSEQDDTQLTKARIVALMRKLRMIPER